MKKRIFFTLIVVMIQMVYSQDFLDEGLFFSSHEVTQEERTSLNLTPNSPIDFKSKLSIEFHVNFRRGDGYYGNIAQIIGNKDININLVANLDDENENFWLILKDKILFKYKWTDIPRGDYNKWIKFQIEFNKEKQEISLSVNGYKLSKSDPNVENIDDFNIIFGKSNHKKFITTDVCPMSIKNIKIFNAKNKLIRNWTLGRHTSTNKVYDNIITDMAIVENPTWLIDKHVFWSSPSQFSFSNLMGTANDTHGERVFFINNEAVYVYSLASKSFDTLNYQKETLKCESDYFVFNHLSNELIAYSIDEKSQKSFDFESLKWTKADKPCGETGYFHHTKIISPQDSTLLTFGGYGFYTYKSEINRFNSDENKIETYDLSQEIAPRYLSASGVYNNDQFLLFGGYGSPSGNQAVNSQYYYDLYSVNLKDFAVDKLWKTDNFTDMPFVPVSKMVIDSNSESFYTLIYNNTNYNTDLRLAKFGILTSEIVVYPDSIPYQFLDIKSNVDFFLNSKNSKLHALTITENNASLSSISYPPLFSDDIYQNEPDVKYFSKSYWLYIILGGFIIITALLFYRKYAKNKIDIPKETPTPLDDKVLELVHKKTEKLKKSAIYLFGGFQVYDKEGHDITALFTPTLKQLFLVILLSTIKKDKGISSTKLTDVLWPNKSESNARNNKNVNISKLRLLLDKIGDIEIVNENAYWKMKISESVYCDYNFIKKLLNDSIDNKLEKIDVNKLLNIVSNGEISPDIQSEWIEEYRSDMTNLIIDDLVRISKSQNDLHLLIFIGNTVLKYDPLNENAIAIKCNALYKLGKKGEAKRSYNKFSKEYLEVLDAEYDKAFKDLIT